MKNNVHFYCKTMLLALIFGMTVFAGCGPKDTRPVVSGTITFNGMPLESGTVQFAQDNAAVFATQIANGKYELKADPGNYRISVTSMKVTGSKPRNEFPGDTLQELVEVQIIPKNYNVNSTLSYTVPATGGVYDIDLIAKE